MKGSNSDNTSEEEFCTFVSGLPREKWWEISIAKWEGYWYKNDYIKAAMAAQSGFLVRDDDVILASSMKTGTTWLKALIPCIMAHNRSTVDDINTDPLLTNHPNQLMPSIEISIFSPKNLNSKVFNVDEMASPRLFRTHLPYSKLPETIKSSSSSCKLVYITRDPKDHCENTPYQMRCNNALIRLQAKNLKAPAWIFNEVSFLFSNCFQVIYVGNRGKTSIM
ncbi:cytosolic sulfotransferase 12-like [Lycium barbarum]|uniref:cytosolic sulfotransferase 12-like n=1 Tax=Lycium barbarum TaxID=112863 RepID=UPI00293F7335|nr:cytosolic sulfotransferase 12-like [Lycium barbarum]